MKRAFQRIAAACAAAALLTVPAGASEEYAEQTADMDSLTGAAAVIETFLEEHEIPRENIAIGFLHPETGEEYFVNGDEYFFAASLYKVALNMYFAEKVHNGELTWDTRISGYPLGKLQEGSLVHSNNDYSFLLVAELGSVKKSRIAVASYYGLTEEEAKADKKYLTDSWTTAEQMLCCMETLYSRSEDFPNVIDCLLEAQPGNYLRLQEDRWPIAQKYGYYYINGRYINVAGIIYTDSPFLLVVMTRDVSGAKMVMSLLCSRLGEYVESLSPPIGSHYPAGTEIKPQ